MKKLLSGAALSACAIGMATTAGAAGFQVKEQSSLAQSYSFAGATAAAEDPTYMYFNPAAIAYHPGFTAAGGTSVIIPTAKVTNATATVGVGGGFAATTGPTDTTNRLAVVPSSAFSAQVTDEVFVGLGISAPFGLVTEYDDDWIGRYHGTLSDLLTINVAPTVAYRPIPEVTFAAGVQVEYAKATLEQATDTAGVRNAVNAALAGAIGNSGVAAGSADAISGVEGDDIAFGFTLGLMVEPVKGTRLGVGYRSEIEHDVRLEAYNQATNAAATANLAALNAAGFLTNGAAQTTVSAPAQLHIGLYHEFNDRFALMADAQWTQWSSFQELRIDFEDNSPDSVTEEKWDDTWFLAIGGRYKPSEQWTIRAGVAYDQGAAPDNKRTPRIPDADRYWGSFGGEYQYSEALSLTGSYTYVGVADSTINLTASATNSDANRGSLNASVEADVHILTLGGQYKF